MNELSKRHRWSWRHKAQGQEQKKIRGLGQEQLFREQTLSRPRAGMLEAKAKDQEHRRQVFYEKKRSSTFFLGDLKNNYKVFNHIFQPIARKS